MNRFGWPLWMRILVFHRDCSHLPLYKYARQVDTASAHFNNTVWAMQKEGFLKVVNCEGRGTRKVIVLSEKGLRIAGVLSEVERELFK